MLHTSAGIAKITSSRVQALHLKTAAGLSLAWNLSFLSEGLPEYN